MVAHEQLRAELALQTAVAVRDRLLANFDRAAGLPVESAERARLLTVTVVGGGFAGIETIAEVWSGSPADSLAGCLWRLFLLRSWVHADPLAVSREYDAGLRRAPVARVVAGTP